MNISANITPISIVDGEAMVRRPLISQITGEVLGVRLDRMGAPKGCYHRPTAIQRMLDRKGRPYNIILTELIVVPSKAEQRWAKKRSIH